jgi:hypothetical protein
LHNSRNRYDSLSGDIQKYINLSLASTTQQTYSSGEKRFINFIQLYKRQQLEQCLPASESLLTEFVAFLAKTIKYPSIKIYLAAVRHFHIRRGFQLNLNKMLRLQLVLRGVKRSHGQKVRVRLPITIHHLKIFKMLLALPYSQNFDSQMIWAAMTLAFFGFLRLGELTCNSKFNPDIHLTRDSIIFHPNIQAKIPQFMTVRIKESKTDPFRLGHTITVGATYSAVCPVQALQKYILLRPTTPGPLFIKASGKPLTKQNLTSETRKLLNLAGLNASNYAGHSYRIGAATTAAEAKLPSWLIKTLGRWSSDCYERYIRTPTSTLSGVSAVLVKATQAKTETCG